ncbi:MAG: PadR family transcriptional regulator [Rhodospirillales bacterium]|jgi:DNA-binding PadR family transcriptional regulator|nr:PadR family transcriptional regulator [Rhodospirillales bacterium]MDP7650491.1 PadR family transcriptional regulator [Rhodospirillales bacterium]
MDVKTLCLGVLTLGEASGYEIKKAFEDGPFAHFHAAGFGSIYPALNRLSAEGFVTCTEETQAGRPPKKVYRIAPAGMSAFRDALGKEPSRDTLRSECLFMLFFGHLLEDVQRRRVFEQYLGTFAERVSYMAEIDLSELPGDRRFVCGFGLAIYRAAIEYMENNRDLLFDEVADPALKTGARK